MKMGKMTDQSTWNKSYSVQFTFSIEGKTYLYGHDPYSKFWFINELNPGGKMGSETHRGTFSRPYDVQFPFSIKGRTFLFSHHISSKSWFISELLPGGRMGSRTTSGNWQKAYHVQFAYWVDNKLFHFAQNKETGHWFIQPLLADGQVGQAITESGQFREPYRGLFTFKVDGKVFFAGQKRNNKQFHTRRLLPNGKMGKTAQRETWGNAYAVLFPYKIRGRHYFYGQNLDTNDWFIQRLLEGGISGGEISGTDLMAYNIQLPFRVLGKQYFYSYDEFTKKWCIRELIGHDDHVVAEDKVTVYIWSMRGSSEAWGHASLKVGNGGPYISWWPSGEGRVSISKAGDFYTAPAIPNHTYQDDLLGEGMVDPDIVIDIPNRLDTSTIVNWWAGFKDKNKWEMLTQNCATTVKDALVAGGAVEILSPRQRYNFENIIVWTPNDLTDLAAAINNGEEKSHQAHDDFHGDHLHDEL